MITWEVCGDGETIVAHEQILAPLDIGDFKLNGISIHFHVTRVGSPSVPFQLFVADMNGDSRKRVAVASLEEGKAQAEEIAKKAREFYL